MYVWITLHAHHSGDDKLESSETGGKKREATKGYFLSSIVPPQACDFHETTQVRYCEYKKCIFFHKELGSKYVLKYFYVLILYLYLRAYIIYTYIIFC